MPLYSHNGKLERKSVVCVPWGGQPNESALAKEKN